MDVAAIEPGRDFRKAIDQSVANCNALLAIIGLEWLETKDATGGRRLDDPNDFVRIELASALRRDIPVIPVLVRGAKMPRVEQLPEDLKELAYRNAVELTHPRWKSDVQVLIRALRPFMDEPSGSSADGRERAGGGHHRRHRPQSTKTKLRRSPLRSTRKRWIASARNWQHTSGQSRKLLSGGRRNDAPRRKNFAPRSRRRSNSSRTA